MGRPCVQAVHDAAARAAILPEALIFQIKNRAINSNWDLTYLGVCALIASGQEPSLGGVDALESFWRALKPCLGEVSWPGAMRDLLDQAGERRGADLVEFAGRIASRSSGAPEAWFGVEGPIWEAAHARFQMWYDGRLTGVWGASPLAERPVIPLVDIQGTLADLTGQGYTLGVATGRPRDEAVKPLTQFGILDRFDPQRMATYDDAQAAQQISGANALGKPHPFVVRKALAPTVPIGDLVAGRLPASDLRALMVGDSASDALAAQAAGIDCLGVLSGVSGETGARERRAALLAAGCVAVVDDVRALPEWLNQRMVP